MKTPEHISVLRNEVVKYLHQNDRLFSQEKRIFVDCTFGYGGYTRAILEENENNIVYAIDRDDEVIPYASEIQQEYGNRFIFNSKCFSDIASILRNHGIEYIDGIVADLGVSSMQLDRDYRGFSFAKEGRLSMDMGYSKYDAHHIVNEFSEIRLVEIFRNYGDEHRYAKKIAKAIVEYRKKKRIETTTELSDIILSQIHKRDKIHPATKVFQAIRICVNNEMGELETLLQDSIEFLRGNMVIVTFHSLEDRIVKNFMKYYCPKRHMNKYEKYSNKEDQSIYEGYQYNLLITKPIVPTKEEVSNNVRARSAKLRVMSRHAI